MSALRLGRLPDGTRDIRIALGVSTPLELTATGCWVWTGRVDNSGYGMVSNVRVHRMAYEQAHGPIPDGLWVLHHCDNPPCVNPAHLFVGTQADNMADMVRKGRQNNAAKGSPGERNPRAILSAAQVAEIRESSATARETARRYGVAMATVRDIRQGRRWRAAS